ncbi:MAG: fibronectin type III domain-containing protein [Candidatus Thorarchaeota archaeon]
MKKNTKHLICLLIVIGLTSVAFVPPVRLAIASSLDSDTLRARLLEFMDAWQLTTERDLSAGMDEAWELGSDIKKHLPADMAVPYDWRHTFNFTNSGDYFSDFVMQPEEVESNLRNYIFQLLYSDIQAACEVSIFDILLFRVFDSLIIDWIDMEFAGFCNGFAQASRDYFVDPGKIPLGRDYAHLLPDPNPNITIAEATGGDVSEAAIKEYVLWKGSGAFFNPNHLLNWIKIYLGIPTPQGGITNAQEVQKMMDEMLLGSPHYAPQVVLLMAPVWEVPEPTSSHFVNIYDYDLNANGSITLYIYNNWYRYDETWTKYDDWILIQPDGSFQGTRLAPYGDNASLGESMFTRLSFYPDTGEYNSIITALIDLLPKLLGLGIFSPVDIEVTDPLGRTISIGDDGVPEVEFPAIMVEDEGEKQILFPFAPGLPYTINLTGTDVGEYRMEANRMVDGKLVTEEVVGETVPGQNDIFTITLDSSGINVAEIGVYLSAPKILSGSAVELEWTQFNEPEDFVAYEIYYSEQPNQLGTLFGSPITDVSQTSAIVSGLTGETTYFFTVRVVTSGDIIYDSNRVGASLPADYTFWLYVAAGVVGFAVLLLVIFVCRRRKS